MSSGAVNSDPLQTGTDINVNQHQAADKSKQGGEITGATKISSLEDLKKKAPKVWKAMMMGIGMSICKDMEKGQARIKELNRKARQEAHQG